MARAPAASKMPPPLAGGRDSRRAFRRDALLGARARVLGRSRRDHGAATSDAPLGDRPGSILADCRIPCSISRSRRIAAIVCRYWDWRARSPRSSALKLKLPKLSPSQGAAVDATESRQPRSRPTVDIHGARLCPRYAALADGRNQDRAVADLAQAPARTLRDAPAQQRGRRNELRDARTGSAAACFRSRADRERQDRRAARGRRPRIRNPRQRAARPRSGRPDDRRPRQAARDRGRHGRAELRGQRLPPPRSCSKAPTSIR